MAIFFTYHFLQNEELDTDNKKITIYITANTMKYKFLILIAIIFYPYYSIAQEDSIETHIKWHKNNLFLTASYINGVVAPTNIFVKGNNNNSIIIDDFEALNIKFGTQTIGESLQENVLNYPQWGIGLKVLNFHNVDEIGIPLALYGFIDVALLRRNRFTINADLGFGVSFNWRSFNPITNKYNVALGLGQAFMSDAGITLNYELTSHIDLVVGYNFSHYSNGAIKLPNFGINSYSPKVGVKYNFYYRPEFIKKKIPKIKPHGEWVLSTFAGMKNIIFDSVNIDIIEKYEGVFFPAFGMSALYNIQLSHFSKIGIGTTFNYNGSIDAQVAVENNELEDVDGPFADKFQLSIYPSYELSIDRISVMLQPAFYIYRKKFPNMSPIFHQRISINYQITDQLFAGITLRDFKMHADFIEWTLGYRINSK